MLGGQSWQTHQNPSPLGIWLYIHIICEQPSKLADTEICISWTLVFGKRKKLRLAMGAFQIAIPHDSYCNSYMTWVLISSSACIYDRLGLRVERKAEERTGKWHQKKKEQERIRKRKQKGKGKRREKERERKWKEKGKGKEKEREKKGKGKGKKNKKKENERKRAQKGEGKGKAKKKRDRQRKGKGKEQFYKQMTMHPPVSAKKRVDFSDTIAMPLRYTRDSEVHRIPNYSYLYFYF